MTYRDTAEKMLFIVGVSIGLLVLSVLCLALSPFARFCERHLGDGLDRLVRRYESLKREGG